MQFLVTKRPITEKVINSFATHRGRPGTAGSYRHTQWCNLVLPFGDERWNNFTHPSEFEEVVVTRFKKGGIHKALKEVVIPRRRTHKAALVKALPSRVTNDSRKVLGIGGGESSGFSKGAGTKWIAAFKAATPDGKSNLHREKDVGTSRFRGRGRRFGKKEIPFEEDAEWYTPARSLKTNREELSNENVDAVLVLAGGQIAGGGIPVWVERRLDRALELHRNNGGVCKIVCLGGGTPHKPPILSSEGFIVHESSSCVEYLHSRGAHFCHLIKEWASYDTIGNGYFSLTQHVIPRRWRKLAVVTSEFHMPRTKTIFEWIFGLQGAGIALQQRRDPADIDPLGVIAAGSEAQGFRLEFHSVPDNGVIEDKMVQYLTGMMNWQARLVKERRSIENLNILIQQIHTLEDFHEWFHAEHKAYNYKDQHLFGKEKLDPALLSY